MTICGYNARMGDGLLELFEGMFDAISDKAGTEGSDVASVLRRELVEIPQVNAGLAQGTGTPLRMFEGLNGMALPLFRELAADPSYEGSRGGFMRAARRFVATLEAVEGYSETLPQPADGSEFKVAERAARIGRWAADTQSLQDA